MWTHGNMCVTSGLRFIGPCQVPMTDVGTCLVVDYAALSSSLSCRNESIQRLIAISHTPSILTVRIVTPRQIFSFGLEPCLISGPHYYALWYGPDWASPPSVSVAALCLLGALAFSSSTYEISIRKHKP